MARHSMAGRLRISALAGLLPRAFRTRRRRRTALAVAVAVLGAGVGYGQLTGAWTARADEHMAGHDTLRTSWDSKEPNLSASTVTGSNFGQLFATTVKGQVYAQPLVIGNTVVVNTEDDWVYGLDAATGAVKWAKDFGPPWPASTIGCADLAPNLGSTSTAVYDPASNTVYLTTKVNDGVDAHHPNWYLHAVDATTGAHRRHPHQRRQPPVRRGERQPAPRPAAHGRRRVPRVRLAVRLPAQPVRRLRGRGEHRHPRHQHLVRRGRGEQQPRGHLARRWRPGLRRSGADLRGYRQRGNPAERSGHQPAAAAVRVGGPARRGQQRHHLRQRLLQPGQRGHPRPERPGPGLRRAGGAAGAVLRHRGDPQPARRDRQGRPAVPAQPRQPGRQGAGLRRYRRRGADARAVQGRVGPPGRLRRR